jgi:hypothetical protein
MLWAGLLLAGSVTGAAIAAAGLLVRPTRLALPLHALGLALAFAAGGAFLTHLSEWTGQGSDWAGLIMTAGLILAFIILPFCVAAALVATAARKWPPHTAAISMLTLIVVIASPWRDSAVGLFMTSVVSALLVAPTVGVHRHIRTVALENAGYRLQAVLGWTLINALLVVFCGVVFIRPLLNDWVL